MNRCVIFTGGKIDDDFSFIEKNNLKESFIICADSGYNYAEKLNIIPDIIVGDYDSLGFIPENIKEKLVFPVEKDDTDLMLAIKEAIKRGYKEIDIYGGFGGRFDHLFGNIQALAFIADHDAEGRLISEHEEVMILNPGKYRFKRRDNYSLSLFAYSDIVSGLSISGAKYTLCNAVLTSSFPLGASNIIVDEFAEISIKSGRLLAVQSKMINNISENA